VDLSEASENYVLCEAMIVMAHKLGIMVVAEGVETPLQHEILKSIGCDFAQGYLFAKPKSESRVEEFLLRHKAKQSAEH
jgi:EAL domain-containing protein (putative c-di-GMP-specific phosphodiesterase class I)